MAKIVRHIRWRSRVQGLVMTRLNAKQIAIGSESDPVLHWKAQAISQAISPYCLEESNR